MREAPKRGFFCVSETGMTYTMKQYLKQYQRQYQRCIKVTDKDDYISVNTVSGVTGLSRNTLYRYMNEGLLNYIEGKQGRLVKRSDAIALEPKRPHKAPDNLLTEEIKRLTNEVYQLRQEVTLLRNVIQAELVQKNRVSETVLTHKDNVIGTDMTQKNRVKVTPNRDSLYEVGKSSNEGRQLEAIAKVQTMIDKYQDASERPSMAAMAKEIGMDRGTFIKHFKRLLNCDG